ncbi:hypothetical protein ES332_A08G051000v1 [Gossypium tomentosum]|uniref:Uncharacterized protein n=1 Tax=Gossypium tomentosum TaxID=34277 RepID=A0A5D2PBL2_GOSTO|nr:hypothetical protein ES332_A08G051000v1 [Gossypium tomentosum]
MLLVFHCLVVAAILSNNFVPSSEQVVDVLTKPITLKQFRSFRQALRVLTLTDAFNCAKNKETGRMLE